MKKEYVFGILFVIIITVLSVFMNINKFTPSGELVFETGMSIKELAQANGTPAKGILHVLSHEMDGAWELDTQAPINTLNLDTELVREAIEHSVEDSAPLLETVRYFLWAVLLVGVFIIVLRQKNISKYRTWILISSIILFGVALGSTPNPMESVVKFFKMLNDMEGELPVILISLAIFTIFSILGRKFICSWGCQLGAFQESLYNIPVMKKKSNLKVPFILSLSIRIVFFITFFFLLFGIAFGIKNFVLYHHLNFFKLFQLYDIAEVALIVLPIFIIASLLTFRPYCHYICPFGLYSWLLESIAIKRIKVDEDKCINCNKCIKVCPTEAMEKILIDKKKFFIPDCWSCGKCKDACPVDAIEFRP